jgi:hypothetical protein
MAHELASAQTALRLVDGEPPSNCARANGFRQCCGATIQDQRGEGVVCCSDRM